MVGFKMTSGRPKRNSLKVTSSSNDHKDTASDVDHSSFTRFLQVSDIYSVTSKFVGKQCGLVTRQLCSELNQTTLGRIHCIVINEKSDLNLYALSHLLASLRNLRSISVFYNRSQPEYTEVVAEIVQSIWDCIPNLKILSKINLFLNIDRPKWEKWTGKIRNQKRTIVRLQHLYQCVSLRELQLAYVESIDLDCVASCTSLVVLDLSYTHLPEDTSVLGKLKQLKKLCLVGNCLSDVSSLGCLTSLEELYLNLNPVSDITVLGNLTALKTLDLYQTEVLDVTAIGKLTALEKLTLNLTQVSDITALCNLTVLQSLDLSYTQVSDITALGNLTALQSLDVTSTKVADISSLGNLTALRSLDLYGTEISDITTLGNLTALQSLNLGFSNVTDVSALGHLTELRILR